MFAYAWPTFVVAPHYHKVRHRPSAFTCTMPSDSTHYLFLLAPTFRLPGQANGEHGDDDDGMANGNMVEGLEVPSQVVYCARTRTEQSHARGPWLTLGRKPTRGKRNRTNDGLGDVAVGEDPDPQDC